MAPDPPGPGASCNQSSQPGSSTGFSFQSITWPHPVRLSTGLSNPPDHSAQSWPLTTPPSHGFFSQSQEQTRGTQYVGTVAQRGRNRAAVGECVFSWTSTDS